MILIQHPLPPTESRPREIRLEIDRLTLARRRWRGTAADGTDFGFDVPAPLTHGTAFHATAEAVYRIEQKPEPVLTLPLGEATEAARAGWLIGNLHFAAEIADDRLVVADDPALRQLFAREGLEARSESRIFRPMGGGHSHEHRHDA